MFCKRCGKELADYMSFCPRCGTRAPLTEPIKQPLSVETQLTGQNEVPNADINEANRPEKGTKKQGKQGKKLVIVSTITAIIVLTALIGIFLVPRLLQLSRENPEVSEAAVSENVPKNAVSETEFLENPEVQRVLDSYSDVFAKAKAGVDISSFVANDSEVEEVGFVDKLNYIVSYNPYVADSKNDTQLLYAVYDIANDGSPELLIGWNDIASGTDNVIILDIIGFESGKANRLIPVGHLGPRSRASIRKNGVIRIEGYHGSNCTSFSYYTVTSGASIADLSNRFALNDWKNAGLYYDIGDYNWDGGSFSIDKKFSISKKEFEAFEAKYPDLTDSVKWIVLNNTNDNPYLDTNHEKTTTESPSSNTPSSNTLSSNTPSSNAPSSNTPSSNAAGALPLSGYCLTTDALNVRTGPGTDYSIIKVLPKNAEVYVTGVGIGLDGKTWASIEGSGYVCADYLVPEENAGKYYQTTDALNVRTGPGTGYSVIKVLPVRTRVKVMSTEIGSDGKTWARLESGGYVCADYLAPEGTGY